MSSSSPSKRQHQNIKPQLGPHSSASPSQLILSPTDPTGVGGGMHPMHPGHLDAFASPLSSLPHPSQYAAPHHQQQPPPHTQQQAPPPNPRKRRASGQMVPGQQQQSVGYPVPGDPSGGYGVSMAGGLGGPGSAGALGHPVQGVPGGMQGGLGGDVGGGEPAVPPPPVKKGRTNTPWTPAEEQRLKTMRDAGNSWSEIAKTFPTRTEGSVKKHWYKDMHYAEFAEDESAALLQAIKEYESSKWKVIGQKVGKPAKACEQYAKEHFAGKY